MFGKRFGSGFVQNKTIPIFGQLQNMTKGDCVKSRFVKFQCFAGRGPRIVYHYVKKGLWYKKLDHSVFVICV